MIITWPNWWKAIFGPRCGFTIWRGCEGDECIRYRGHSLPHRSRSRWILWGYMWTESDGERTVCCSETDGEVKRTVYYQTPGI